MSDSQITALFSMNHLTEPASPPHADDYAAFTSLLPDFSQFHLTPYMTVNRVAISLIFLWLGSAVLRRGHLAILHDIVRLIMWSQGAVLRIASRLPPFPFGSSSGDGPLKSVFGVERSSLVNALPGSIGQRGLSSFLKGSRSDRPPGLGNWDNSCYQNSVIQGLASLNSLPEYLRNIGDAGVEDWGPDNSTSGALLETTRRLNSGPSLGRVLWLPPKLKSMNTWQQQDAQEYFSKILDQLDKESTTASQKLNRSKGFALSFDEEDHPRGVDADSAYRNALKNPLEGLVAQRVGCLRCGYSEGLSFTQFNCLTVPLGLQRSYDIRDCLDEYANLEPINGVECPKCTILHTKTQLENVLSGTLPESLKQSVLDRLQTVDDALRNEDFSDNTLIKKCVIPKKNWVSTTKSKQTVIGRPPRNLVVHVNRSLFDEYTGAQLKNYAHVRSPLRLDLGAWCIGQVQTTNAGESAKVHMENWETDPRKSMLPPPGTSVDSPWKYELRAAIMHYGRHENGHYVCFRTYPDRQLSEDEEVDMNPKQFKGWWRLSDETVSQVSVMDLQEEGEVFMLFYERVEGADHGATALSVDLAADLRVAADIALPEGDDLDLYEASEDTSFINGHSDPADEKNVVEMPLPKDEEWDFAGGDDDSNSVIAETVRRAADKATGHSFVPEEPTTPDLTADDLEADENSNDDGKRILAMASSGFFNPPPSSSANSKRSPMLMRTAGNSNPHDSDDLLGSGLRIVSAI